MRPNRDNYGRRGVLFVQIVAVMLVLLVMESMNSYFISFCFLRFGERLGEGLSLRRLRAARSKGGASGG
jgi:hypothetical protein